MDLCYNVIAMVLCRCVCVQTMVSKNPPVALCDGNVVHNLVYLYELVCTGGDATRAKRILSTLANRFHLQHLSAATFRLQR